MVVALLGAPHPASPCAPAPPPGARVEIADEEALIVWEPATHRQHFVRRARFRTDAPDFGFLVPTPARPVLDEAPDSVFQRLEDVMRPRVLLRTTYDICPSFLLCPVLFRRRMDDARMGGAVRVLEEKRVAGYQAAVLAADDTRALDEWLKRNGYAHGPALREWALPYLARRWTITAFKVAGGSEGPLGTAAVRMTFTTDHPLFPYREPSDPSAGGRARSLRVYLVAPTRMNGALEDASPWPGRLEFASPEIDTHRLLQDAVPKAMIPARGWLTAFRDESSPRPGRADLVFSVSPDASPVVPVPVVVERPTFVPLPIFEGIVMGGIAWIWRRRARRLLP